MMMMTPNDNDDAIHDSGHFEDVRVNGGPPPMSSLAIALAGAAANERDRRQRKLLVEDLVRTLFDTLAPHPGSENAAVLRSTERSDHIAEQILGEEQTGSTTIPNSFSSITKTKKITWNRDNPLKLHWSWQRSRDGDGAVQYSTCYLSVFAKEGATIEFFAPSSTTPTDDIQKIALCEVSNFQWTLEGTTKKGIGEGEGLEEIQSFWKLESAYFSWISGSTGEMPAEEILMEGTDISLTGKFCVDQPKDESDEIKLIKGPSLELFPNSVLSLKISSVGNLGGSTEEMRRVGMVLREMVAFLDQLVSVPNLNLSLIDFSDKSDEDSPIGGPQEKKIPSFEEEGDNMSLGGAMRYYFKHYCSKTNQKQPTASSQTPKFFSVGDLASFASPIGGVVSVATLAVKDGVEAAARKGKEVRASHNIGDNFLTAEAKARDALAAGAAAGSKIAGRGGALVGSFWGSMGSVTVVQNQEQQPQESTQGLGTDGDQTTNESNGGFRFGDNLRKVVARGKEATDRVVAKGKEASGLEQGERFRFGGFSRSLFASVKGKDPEAPPLTLQEQTQKTQTETQIEPLADSAPKEDGSSAE